ncbi:replication-relaxation family protein [Streptomyces gilvosporeus]|nr:replication-relaxation family protein [Streptomyces gilvosporeus]
MGGTTRRPYGSTAKTRQMVLAALGVVKVATAEQIRQLMCPGTASAQTVRNGCLDLAREGLVESLGSASRINANGNQVTEKLWNLTGPGLEAAATLLDRPTKEMGGTARGAARAGAKHAVKVTDTIAAFLQTSPEPTRPVLRKRSQAATTAPASVPSHDATPAAPAPQQRPVGMGRIASWATEVVLPVAGTQTTPAKGSLRADAVLTAPEHRLPVLFVEVDNGTENPVTLSYKVSRYRDFFRRTVKHPSASPGWQDDARVPLWQLMFDPLKAKPRSRGYWRQDHPPLAIVFTKKVGATAMNNRIDHVVRLTRLHWEGHYRSGHSYSPSEDDSFTDYQDTVPLLLTTLDRLQQHGPLGAVWWRAGHGAWETLADALANPDGKAAYEHREAVRREEERQQREREQREYEEQWEREEREAKARRDRQRAQRAAEEEARKSAVEPDPTCQQCGGPLKKANTATDDPQEDLAPPPDGLRCAACRIQLAEPTTRIGRFIRRVIDRPSSDSGRWYV